MLSRMMARRGLSAGKLAELTAYGNHPRRHPDAQIAHIAGSIAAFGFNAPILIDSRGAIIAGRPIGVGSAGGFDGKAWGDSLVWAMIGIVINDR
jgi:hypothetical protein